MASKTYGTLVEGNLVLAPKNITIGTVTYKPATDAAYIQAGYKPVAYSPYPADGNTYEAYYEEKTKQIAQKWRLVHELTPAERRERAYQSEKCCIFHDEEYTCDELETLYYKYFAEDGKEEYCAEIKAAITAGKAHIREEYPDEPPQAETSDEDSVDYGAGDEIEPESEV